MASKINPLKTDEETLNNKEIKENHLQDIDEVGIYAFLDEKVIEPIAKLVYIQGR